MSSRFDKLEAEVLGDTPTFSPEKAHGWADWIESHAAVNDPDKNNYKQAAAMLRAAIAEVERSWRALSGVEKALQTYGEVPCYPMEDAVVSLGEQRATLITALRGAQTALQAKAVGTNPDTAYVLRSIAAALKEVGAE